jgi:multidrug transporter EmrE-like cation transporter
VIAETSSHLQRSSRRFAVRDGVALWLLRRTYSRLAIAMAIAVSAGIGWACSVVLRQCGLSIMWLRYPLALAAAYVMFVALLGMIVWRAARRLDEGRDQIRRDALRLQFRRNDSELPDANALFDNVSEAARGRAAGGRSASAACLPDPVPVAHGVSGVRLFHLDGAGAAGGRRH